MLTTIASITKIEDQEGQYGPQKRIQFKDSLGKNIAGWIPLNKFNPNEWQTGQSLDLEITQSGKYTNFKYKGGPQSGLAAQFPQEQGNVLQMPQSQGAGSEILKKLELLQATVLTMGLKIDQLTTAVNTLGSDPTRAF